MHRTQLSFSEPCSGFDWAVHLLQYLVATMDNGKEEGQSLALLFLPHSCTSCELHEREVEEATGDLSLEKDDSTQTQRQCKL